jgi:hypothetical protein
LFLAAISAVSALSPGDIVRQSSGLAGVYAGLAAD